MVLTILWLTLRLRHSKGINTPSIKRQRQWQGPIGMHCDAPTQASKLQSAAATDALCGHPLRLRWKTCIGQSNHQHIKQT